MADKDAEFGKRVSELIDSKKLNNTGITKDLGLSKNTIGNYKNGQIPNAKKLLELSQILGTTMEFLLTGKEPEELTAEEQKLINLYRTTDNRGKKNIMRTAEAEADNGEQTDQISISKIG